MQKTFGQAAFWPQSKVAKAATPDTADPTRPVCDRRPLQFGNTDDVENLGIQYMSRILDLLDPIILLQLWQFSATAQSRRQRQASSSSLICGLRYSTGFKSYWTARTIGSVAASRTSL
jgi:hypothetical protein